MFELNALKLQKQAFPRFAVITADSIVSILISR